MVENRYGDCELACVRCSTKDNLMQVAHRDNNNRIVGYVFLCGACLPIIGGRYTVSLEPLAREGKA
jgi:hypothetical protein